MLLQQAKGIQNMEDLMREKWEAMQRGAAASPEDLEFVKESDGGSEVQKL